MSLDPVTVPSLQETSPTRTNTAIRQIAERLATVSTELDSIQAAFLNFLWINAPQMLSPTQQAQGRSNLAISAANTPFTPAGGIASNNVQAGMVELDTEKVAKAGDTMTGSLNMSNGSYVFSSAWGANYALDATPVTSSVANSGIIVIESNFSGLILANNWTLGHIVMYLVGGGASYGFGSTTNYNCAYARDQNGYVVYNNSGSAGVFAVAAIRTRTGA